MHIVSLGECVERMGLFCPQICNFTA